MSAEHINIGIQESKDSTSKKIIYQIPLNAIPQLSQLIKTLEANLSERVIVDIEVNSLEDAYINIVREEEKLLMQLNAGSSVHVEKVSSVDNDQTDEKLARFMGARLRSSFSQQLVGTIGLRLKTYWNSQEDILLSLLPVINTIF